MDRKRMKEIFLVASGVVLFYWVLQNLQTLRGWLGWGLGLMAPFITGLAMAFILNVPMKAIEERLIKKEFRLKRVVSLLLTLLGLVLVLTLVVRIVAPEIGNTVRILRERIPAFFNQLATTYPGPFQQAIEAISSEEMLQRVMNSLKNGAAAMLNSTFQVATSVFSGILNFVLGFVFSIYLLLQKENLGRQVRRLLYAYLPEKITDRVLYIADLSKRIFSNFLTGQCLEAVILGTMFFIAMSILRLPYALMISVLIAITALIPVFGAFIGCVVGAFLILVSNPIQALWFLILFQVLQQIEGNLIYPRVVGSSVGLPGIWVLTAVTIGGGLLGVVGMLIMVPLCSVLYTLLREAVSYRLKKGSVPRQKYQ